VVAQRVTEPGTMAPGAVHPGTRQPFDSDETIRLRAQQSGRVVELLDTMMQEQDATRRWNLARELQDLLRTLGKRVDPAVRDRLLVMLTTVDPQWRGAVGEVLGSLEGDVDTANKLVDMLRNRTGEINTRRAIYAALSKMNVREIAPRLLGMLGENYDDEFLAVRALGSVGGMEETLALLDRMVKHPLRDETRREIETVLQTKRGAKDLMNRIAEALGQEPAVETKRSLVKVLTASDDPEHRAMIREMAKNETDAETRREAILGLGRFGDEESGRILLDLVQTGEGNERLRAVQAIHTIQNSETVEALAKNYDTLDAEGRLAVLGAGARLLPPSDRMATIARDRGLHDDEMRVRTTSARLLGRQRGRDDNVEALGAYLSRSKHPSEWNSALQALYEIGTRKSAEEGIRGLGVVPNDQQRQHWRDKFEELLERTVQR